MDSHYWKYIIGHLLSPFTLLFMIILVSYLFLLFKKKTGGAKVMMGLSITIMYLLSTAYGSNWLLGPLEFKYNHFSQPKMPLAYIVVLGCAHENETFLPASSILQRCSQVRLHEALRLYKTNPSSKVIFTGYGYSKSASLAENMAKFATLAGIKPADIIREGKTYNTEQEVAYVSPIVVDSPTALVTSAAHMPRAMYLFEQQGLTLIPAPTDYLVRMKTTKPHLRFFIPEVRNLNKVNAAAHEYYGMWWFHFKTFFTD
jgi:uncharacterized SAM-binding protein YcdF (DUF218 family)